MDFAHKRIIIRADGSRSIGMGHISRCAVLATELRKLGWKVLFITPVLGKAVADFFHRYHFEFSGYSPPTRDMAAYYHKNIMEEQKTDLTLIDSYLVTDRYRKKLKEWGARIIAVDDTYRHFSHADMVINHNPSADPAEYGDFSAPLLAGPEYALIKPGFGNAKHPNIERPDLLVAMGGTDHKSQADRFVRILDRIDEDFSITLLSGFFGQETEYVNFQHPVRVLAGVDDMPALINQCDAAVTAGGITTLELAVSGRPFAVFTTDYRQVPNAHAWQKMGVGLYAGDTDELSDEQIEERLREFLVTRYERWHDMSSRGMRTVSADGAAKAAKEIDRAFGI